MRVFVVSVFESINVCVCIFGLHSAKPHYTKTAATTTEAAVDTSKPNRSKRKKKEMKLTQIVFQHFVVYQIFDRQNYTREHERLVKCEDRKSCT